MQKRQVRWIAALAVAGTTAVCGTAAARAAMTDQQGQMVSVSCAALTDEFNAAVTQAQKDLAATPPDVAGAQDQLSQAQQARDTAQTMGCPDVATVTNANPNDNPEAAAPMSGDQLAS
ncbi:hypothetical protein KGA66_07690 [Actinocrinis puniceicyclus]|uniref:Secreted protein n=1 Tax=Actinocrinis puniceicyclus TaxID=977794 RepID=A0A8J8BBX5_9ACTN|nr:hypothetical protein [Actinocrinis puniceicyclus]MBS2962920.1 hypothetical protein [Actinocrinis puniceicyclus]